MEKTAFNVEPELVRLNYGGWLAKTGARTKLRIGVIGESESVAREAFSASLRRWKELNESEETEAAGKG